MGVQLKAYRRVQGLIIALMVFGGVMDVLVYPEIGRRLFMGYLSVTVTLGGYLLYIASMYKEEQQTDKRIKPHPLSWTLFGTLTGTGWLIQVVGGGQSGSWCLGVTALSCFVIAALSYAKYEWKFHWDDWICVATGLFLLLFYLVTNSPVLSAVLVTLADFVGYGPTLKKGWRYPGTDNPVNFVFNSAKCVPALLALSSYSWETSVYLWMLLGMNALVAIMLVVRREYLGRSSFGTRESRK